MESIKSAINELLSNKARTCLTMLGMFIGIGSVIMILALGNGYQNYMKESFADMGLGIFAVNCKYSESQYLITQEDIDLIRSFPEIECVMGDMYASGMLDNNKGELFECNVDGVQEGYFPQIETLDLLAGREFISKDFGAGIKNIIISDIMAKALFNDKGYEEVVGEVLHISLNSQPDTYEIIGIYETGIDTNETQETLEKMMTRRRIFMPFDTLDQLYGSDGLLDYISGVVKDGYDQGVIASRVSQLLNRRHHLDDGYQVQTAADMLDMVNNIMDMVTLFISSVAGISLAVGGVGIMNIMLVTVKERTREIGVRKALGASNGNILRQFLIESLMLTLIAGVLGMIMGYVGAILIGNAFDIVAQFTLSMILFATLTSSLIGIVFGVYPAYQAACLDPIEALRAE